MTNDTHRRTRKDRWAKKYPKTVPVKLIRPGLKKNSNSVRSLLRSIRCWWSREKQNEEYFDKTEEFLGDFSASLKELSAHYVDLTGKMSASTWNNYEGNEANSTRINFYHLRAVSNYTGVPTGLLVLYSHLCADEFHMKFGEECAEARPYTYERLSDFLDSAMRCLSEAKQHVEAAKERGAESDNDENVFILPRDTAAPDETMYDKSYFVKLDILKAWAKNFSSYN